MNKKIKKQIIEIVKTNPRHYSRIISADAKLNNALFNEFPMLQNAYYKNKTRIFWLLNDLHDFPKCKICNNEIKHNIYTLNNPQYVYCSKKCSLLDGDRILKIKKTKLMKYGSETYTNRKKAIQTSLERHGVEYFNNSEKAKKTNLERYGNSSVLSNDYIREKIKQTNLERYGYEYPMQNNTIKEKIKQSNLEKYGSYYIQTDDFKQKSKNTCKIKYGTEYAIQSKDQYKKRIEKIYKKYGIKNVFQLKEVRRKIEKIKFERYGDKNYLNRKKIKQTNLEKYGYENPTQNKIIKEKIKQTNLKKYGHEYIFQTPCFYKKAKNTKLKRYGDENYLNREKAKNTKLKRYGDENYLNREKAKQTCMNKFGASSYFGSKEFNKLRQDPKWKQHNIEKIINTKIKNKTFNTSKSENLVYVNLCKKFNPDDIIRQYKSEKYPFRCDFYIKSIDTYIECNFSWTHGGHWFNPNNSNDFLLVEKWKSKKTKYYNNAIQTWTIRDLKKKEYAEKNNLKYLVFWKIEDFFILFNISNK